MVLTLLFHTKFAIGFFFVVHNVIKVIFFCSAKTIIFQDFNSILFFCVMLSTILSTNNILKTTITDLRIHSNTVQAVKTRFILEKKVRPLTFTVLPNLQSNFESAIYWKKMTFLLRASKYFSFTWRESLLKIKSGVLNSMQIIIIYKSLSLIGILKKSIWRTFKLLCSFFSHFQNLSLSR